MPPDHRLRTYFKRVNWAADTNTQLNQMREEILAVGAEKDKGYLGLYCGIIFMVLLPPLGIILLFGAVLYMYSFKPLLNKLEDYRLDCEEEHNRRRNSC